MGGDYTRLSFDPRKNFSGVRMQQGRVQVDSDWNELIDILDRRSRAEALDVFGPCAVPAETPDGFRILVAKGSVSIGVGRMYVDGVLVENHGDLSSSELDPLLGEVRGRQPVDYRSQPYLPNAATVAPLPDTSLAIAYVDAWQREVTAVQDPGLIERALGVETATRLQTVWQVRILPVANQNLAVRDVETAPEWRTLVTPPAGRLSISTVSGAESPGYSGGENCLYRIEIHDSGAAGGGTTFKWSSSNGSAVATVTAISEDRTEIAVTGTALMGVQPGDWIEIQDDWRELAGQPGVMARVERLDLGIGQLGLSAALPEATFDASQPDRHTRARRWDQRGSVHDADGNPYANVDDHGGVIPVPDDGRRILLEHGISVSFTPGTPPVRPPQLGRPRVRHFEEEIVVVEEEAGRLEVTEVDVEVDVEQRRQRRQRRRPDPTTPTHDYRTGSYWTFAVRADGWLEALTDAPPRGIWHHYCPLAIVSSPDHSTDCRVIWPEVRGREGRDRSAVVWVDPKSHADKTLTIQQAVDQVKSRGGTVLLGAGLYLLDQPLDLSEAISLRLSGTGWATVLLYRGDGAAVEVEQAVGVTVENMTVVAAATEGDASQPRLQLGSEQLTGSVQQLWSALQALIDHYRGPWVSAFGLRDSAGVCVQGCTVIQVADPEARTVAIALAGVLLDVKISKNLIIGASGIGNHQVVGEKIGPYLRESVNMPEAGDNGPAIQYLAVADLTIDGNRLFCTRKGISLEGLSLHAADTRITGNRITGGREGGIFTTGFIPTGAAGGHHLTIVDNVVRTEGDGITIGVDGARVVGNDVSGRDEIAFEGLPAIDDTSDPTQAQEDHTGSGIVVTRGLRLDRTDDSVIKDNWVHAMAGHAVAISGRIGALSIEANRLSNLGRAGIDMSSTSSGQRISVIGNSLEHVIRIPHNAPTPVSAIRLRHVQRAEVHNNSISGVGQTSRGSAGRAGIYCLGCEVVRSFGNELSDFGSDGSPLPDSAGIDVVGPFGEVGVADNVVRIGTTPSAGGSAWRALRIGQPTEAQTLQMLEAAGAAVIDAVTGFFARTFQHRDSGSRQQPAAPPQAAPPGGSSPPAELVSVRGNVLEAVAPIHTVEISVNGPCAFIGNQCLRKRSDYPGRAIVTVQAGATALQGNQVLGGGALQDALEVIAAQDNDPVSVVGNIVEGSLRVDSSRAEQSGNIQL